MSRPRKHPQPNKTTLRVGGFDYTVKLVRGHIYLDGEECVGLFDHKQQLILISDEQCVGARWATLWHEIAHAAHTVLRKGDSLIGRETVAEFVEDMMTGVKPGTLRQLARVCKATATEAAPIIWNTKPRAAAAKRRRSEARR